MIGIRVDCVKPYGFTSLRDDFLATLGLLDPDWPARERITIHPNKYSINSTTLKKSRNHFKFVPF
jgi:hypothetical protein